MKSKNILIFCASMQKGGAERVISLLLKELENERSIKVYFMMMENGIDYDLPKSITPIILSNSKKSGVQKLLELPFVALNNPLQSAALHSVFAIHLTYSLLSLLM